MVRSSRPSLRGQNYEAYSLPHEGLLVSHRQGDEAEGGTAREETGEYGLLQLLSAPVPGREVSSEREPRGDLL